MGNKERIKIHKRTINIVDGNKVEIGKATEGRRRRFGYKQIIKEISVSAHK
jgi:hypothetical protein